MNEEPVDGDTDRRSKQRLAFVTAQIESYSLIPRHIISPPSGLEDLLHKRLNNGVENAFNPVVAQGSRIVRHTGPREPYEI